MLQNVLLRNIEHIWKGNMDKKHNLKSDFYVVEVYRKSTGVLQVRKGPGIVEQQYY